MVEEGDSVPKFSVNDSENYENLLISKVNILLSIFIQKISHQFVQLSLVNWLR